MTQDYFAELYVAGLMANAGWNVYFPHRDKGMDFIISKTGADGTEIIRPVQVKGKYPSEDKGDKTTYGYVDNRWEGGACYDPESGKSYKCKMHLRSTDKLELRGYIGISLFGRTFVLTR